MENLSSLLFFFYIYWIVNFLIDSFVVRSCQLKRNMFAERNVNNNFIQINSHHQIVPLQGDQLFVPCLGKLLAVQLAKHESQNC